MGPGPHEDLVLVDDRVEAGLESLGVVVCQSKPSCPIIVSLTQLGPIQYRDPYRCGPFPWSTLRCWAVRL